MSRARQESVGAVLAPKILETLAELQNRRPPRAGPRDSSCSVGHQPDASESGGFEQVRFYPI